MLVCGHLSTFWPHSSVFGPLVAWWTSSALQIGYALLLCGSSEAGQSAELQGQRNSLAMASGVGLAALVMLPGGIVARGSAAIWAAVGVLWWRSQLLQKTAAAQRRASLPSHPIEDD